MKLIRSYGGVNLKLIVYPMFVMTLYFIAIGYQVDGFKPGNKSTYQIIPVTACKGDQPELLHNESNPWFEPSTCKRSELLDTTQFQNASEIGFLFSLCIISRRVFDIFCSCKARKCYPSSEIQLEKIIAVYAVIMPMDGENLSPWHQMLSGALQLKISSAYPLHCTQKRFTIVSRLAYSDKLSNGVRTSWELYDVGNGTRLGNCTFFNVANDSGIISYEYSCPVMPLFQLTSILHDYYLLNMRLFDSSESDDYLSLVGIYLHTDHIKENLTKYLLLLKCPLLFDAIVVIYWYRRRVAEFSKNHSFMNDRLFVLNLALIGLDLPYELFSLYNYDIPIFNSPLLGDVSQVLFVSALLHFFSFFSHKHIHPEYRQMIVTISNKIKLSFLGFYCLSLFYLNIVQLTVQAINPFNSIWVQISETLPVFMICFSTMCAVSYFWVLMRSLVLIFYSRTSSVKQINSTISSDYFQKLCLRYFLVTLITVLCAGFTLSWVILSQIDNCCKWSKSTAWVCTQVTVSPIYRTCMLGMWNLYVFIMVILFSPSKKTVSIKKVVNGSPLIRFANINSGGIELILVSSVKIIKTVQKISKETPPSQSNSAV